jgi:hypothetical protein
MRMAVLIYASNSSIHEKIPFALEQVKTDECARSAEVCGGREPFACACAGLEGR